MRLYFHGCRYAPSTDTPSLLNAFRNTVALASLYIFLSSATLQKDSTVCLMSGSAQENKKYNDSKYIVVVAEHFKV